MDQLTTFEAQVARFRESGWLGRSDALARLFDFLVEARRNDRVLREVDVAQEVFGRGAELSGDASVRVYIHRLRKKLIGYYAGPGAAETHRLAVPLGEYRLELASVTTDADAAPQSAPRRRLFRTGWIGLGIAAAVILNLGAWAWIARATAPERAALAVARTPPWSMLSGRRPVLVVIGDYYIFGETDGLEVSRMVREFDINSPGDLANFLMLHPELQGRYVDLDTDYTPTGASLALKDVIPAVRAAVGDPARIQIITSSALTPDMLKSADIVYVGYLSGLRLLEQPVFAASRLKVGETYDNLVDRKTGRSYLSYAINATREQPNTDFGYLRAFKGPSGNQIVVIAGTRDIGVMQMAETAASGGLKLPDGAESIEKLYEVRGVGRTNLSAREVDLDRPPAEAGARQRP